MTHHLKRLQNILNEQKVQGLFISSHAHISYLTGYQNFIAEEREAYLLITKNQAYIFTDGRYSEAIRKQVAHFELVELGRGVRFSDLLRELKNKEKMKVLGIEENDLKVSEFRLLSSVFPQLKSIDIESLRIIKQDWEIKNIQKACQLGDRTFKHILKIIKPGMTELQVAWEMEKYMKEHGGRPSFDTIVAFDKNASIPHHHTGQAKLKNQPGQFILLDFGVKINGYCSDMSRTVFFGSPSEKQKKMYQAVLGAQKKAVEYIKKYIKNAKAAEADRIAREYIKQQGFLDFSHSLGHGIGLQVHEAPHLSPHSKEILREGMVFSIEPGIYIPNFGGVRIEDLFVIQKGKLIELTKSSKIISILGV